MPSFKQKYTEIPVGSEDDGYYPGFHLSGDTANPFAKLSVGEEVTMVVRARVASQHAHKTPGGGVDRGVGFDMLSGEVTENSGKGDAEVLFDGE